VTAESSACTAQSFADPTATVVPRAYSFAEYSALSTIAPVLVAQSFEEPSPDTALPNTPTAHSF